LGGIRGVYVPGLWQYLSKTQDEEEDTFPEEIKLWLPSALTPSRAAIACVPGLTEIEDKLRTAHCYDTLESLRHTLRIKTRMVQFKNKNIQGQREGLRSTSVIDWINLKARCLVEKYRRARAAKLALVGEGRWCEVLKPLADGDVRAYTDRNQKKQSGRKGTVVDESHQPWRGGGISNNAGDDDNEGKLDLQLEMRTVRDGTGETHKTLSWIWLMEGVRIDESTADSDEILRSEWAKSRARAKRGIEEVRLLREEMRRALEFLEWRSKWWILRQTSREVACPELAEGLRAYAQEQSDIQKGLLDSWRNIFSAPLAMVDDATEEEEEEEEEGDGV